MVTDNWIEKAALYNIGLLATDILHIQSCICVFVILDFFLYFLICIDWLLVWESCSWKIVWCKYLLATVRSCICICKFVFTDYWFEKAAVKRYLDANACLPPSVNTCDLRLWHSTGKFESFFSRKKHIKFDVFRF